MAGTVTVKAEVLDSAATNAADISSDLKPHTSKATTDSGDAAASMNGWSIAGELGQIQSSWQKAFQLVHGKLDASAANLRTTAGNYRAAEQNNAAAFQTAGR